MDATTATSPPIAGHTPPADMPDGPALLTVHEVAGLLHCSARTVYRLADSGRMPRPVRLGALVRWHRATINEWIDGGCPAPQRRVR